MTKEELARKLDLREYGEEMTPLEEAEANESGLVVIFGYSDDNAEIKGAIDDEVGCYNGGEIFIHQGGVMETDHDCDCDYCGWKQKAKGCAKITALWLPDNTYSWVFKTDLPHATFDIVEDGERFCKGLVINFSDLPKL